MANDFQITAEDFGRQIARGAKAMLALHQLDEKLNECITECIVAGCVPVLTASQKKTIRKAIAERDTIVAAVERMNAQFGNFA